MFRDIYIMWQPSKTPTNESQMQAFSWNISESETCPPAPSTATQNKITSTEITNENMKKDEIPPRERGDTGREQPYVSPLFSSPIFTQLHEGIENEPGSDINRHDGSHSIAVMETEENQLPGPSTNLPSTSYEVSECRPGGFFSKGVNDYYSPPTRRLRPRIAMLNNDQPLQLPIKCTPEKRSRKNSRIHFRLNENRPERKRGRPVRKRNSPKRPSNLGQLWVPITPQMIKKTLERLHFLKQGAKLSDIIMNMRLHYPLRPDAELLSKELRVKMNCALKSGFITKNNNNTLRFMINHEFPLYKKVLKEFWLRYLELPEEPPSMTKSELDLLHSASSTATTCTDITLNTNETS